MIRYHLACAAFEVCTYAGAQFGGDRLFDRLQRAVLGLVVLHAPRPGVTELRCNSPLSKTIKIGLGPRP